MNGSILGLLVHGAANVAAAVLSDRLGRRPVMMTGAVASAAAALVIFPLSAQGTVAAVSAAIVLG